MKPEATPAAEPRRAPEYDVLHELEQDLYVATRVRGALRAVQHLVQPWRFSESEQPDVVENVHREDLAALLDILQSDLAAQLGKIEGHVYVLQGYGRTASHAVDKARGR